VVDCHVQFDFAQCVKAAALGVDGIFHGFLEAEDL